MHLLLRRFTRRIVGRLKCLSVTSAGCKGLTDRAAANPGAAVGVWLASLKNDTRSSSSPARSDAVLLAALVSSTRAALCWLISSSDNTALLFLHAAGRIHVPLTRIGTARGGVGACDQRERNQKKKEIRNS